MLEDGFNHKKIIIRPHLTDPNVSALVLANNRRWVLGCPQLYALGIDVINVMLKKKNQYSSPLEPFLKKRKIKPIIYGV